MKVNPYIVMVYLTNTVKPPFVSLDCGSSGFMEYLITFSFKSERQVHVLNCEKFGRQTGPCGLKI